MRSRRFAQNGRRALSDDPRSRRLLWQLCDWVNVGKGKGFTMKNDSMSRRSFVAGVGSLAFAVAFLPLSAQASDLAIQGEAAVGLTTQAKTGKSAVVYFSCTGTTAGAAKRVKKATGATLVRVKAKQPYSDDDIDWADESSRVTQEHNSASSPAKSAVRPDIANLKQIKTAVKSADVVYLGYPIWWGEAPHIMYTLIEKISLKGKTVVPFCTSMSSGVGASAKHLKARANVSKSTVWKKGKGFYSIPSQKAVGEWLARL